MSNREFSYPGQEYEYDDPTIDALKYSRLTEDDLFTLWNVKRFIDNKEPLPVFEVKKLVELIERLIRGGK